MRADYKFKDKSLLHHAQLTYPIAILEYVSTILENKTTG